MQLRKIIVLLEVDDEKAIAEDIGTIEYLEKEIQKLHDNGIILNAARILDDDDKHDQTALALTDKIFLEEDENE